MSIPSYVNNAELRTWVAQMVDLCKPNTDLCSGLQMGRHELV